MSSVGIEALSKLRYLRHFNYCFEDNVTEDEPRCLLLCAQHLPRLQCVGSTKLLSDWDQMLLLELDYDIGSFHDEVVKQPFTLGLRQMMLEKKDTVPHKEFLVPDLQALHLSGPRNDVVDLCDRYSTVSHLGLHRSNADLVIKTLQGVGGRLTRLWLADTEGDLSLSTILQLCPNLVQFKINKLTCGDWHIQLPKNVLLSSLEEVSMDLNFNSVPHHIIIKVIYF